jgi:hypothetical protein
MLISPDVRRDVNRRILVCPHCHRPQVIPPQSEGFAVGCKNCHREFCITDAGAVADVEALRTADGAATPERTPGERLRAMLGGVRSVVITALVLVVVAEAVRQFGSLGAVRSAGKGALLVGSMTAPAEDMARVLGRERDARREAVSRYDRQIAAAGGDASARALWSELKRRDMEEVQLLDRRLAGEARHAR